MSSGGWGDGRAAIAIYVSSRRADDAVTTSSIASIAVPMHGLYCAAIVITHVCYYSDYISK